MTDRLFAVAPDAIHVRLVYQPKNGYYTAHVAVVERDAYGDVDARPVGRYEDLTAQEAIDVVLASLDGMLA